MHYASAPSSSGPSPQEAGPPSPAGASGSPDATARSVRRTAQSRPLIRPHLLRDEATGFPATHPYVRRFWIPLLGPGAVADFCRLAAAARSGRPLKLPLHLDALARRGLVVHNRHGGLGVAPSVRPLRPPEVRRLPPSLRTEHRRYLASRSATTA